MKLKPSQTVLLLALLVAIVFGVTFASMYVSRTPATPVVRPKDGRVNPALHLTFERQSYPDADASFTQAPMTEYGQMGQYDFWFENRNSEEVRVGLDKKSCASCSEVQVFVAPRSWHDALAQAALSWTGVSGDPLAYTLPRAAVMQKRGELAASATDLKTLEAGSSEGVTVPAKSFGFIRLQWEAKRMANELPRPERFSADLWWNTPQAGGTKLEVGAALVPPLRLDVTDVTAGTLGPGTAVAKTVYLLSSTRDHLEEPVIDSTASAFITCTRPEPITEEDRRELERRSAPLRLRAGARGNLTLEERRELMWASLTVRSGYRITITVREQAANGSRFDEGSFLHHVRIKPRDKIVLADPLEVTVRGIVRGDVSLIGADSAISLGPFAVRNGTRHQVRLQIERKDLSLKIGRVPDFMKAQLGEPETDSMGRRIWLLTLEIAPNKISGTFPRPDSPAYRDTAIYLTIEGAAKRSLRIPVTGNALQ
jgi:hypothetical protein